jgi:hypothetical protein
LLRYTMICQNILWFEDASTSLLGQSYGNLVISIMRYPEMSPRLCLAPSLCEKIHQMN